MHWKFKLRRHFVFLRQLFWEAFREKMLISFVATCVFATLIVMLNNFFYDSHIWDGFYTETGIEDVFCEFTDMKRFVRQPINTFTNFIYLINGMYFFSKGLEDMKKKRSYNLITANHFYSFVLSFISFYVFATSSFFHSSLVEVASDMDFSGVYSISLFPLMYLSHRVLLTVRGKDTSKKYWTERLILIILFSSIYLLLTFVIPMHYVHPIVGTFILLIIGFGTYLEKKSPNTNKDYLIATGISITMAVVFFEFDFKKIMCNPHILIYPHSLWHLFNGMSIFFFYLYIRSESYKPEHDNLRSNLKRLAHDKVWERYEKSNE